MRPFRAIDLDEALVIDEIANFKLVKNISNSDFTTFIPSNPRQQGVDILFIKGNKYNTIQVKGSRIYNVNTNQLQPPSAWFTLDSTYFTSPIIKIDFFIFVFHTIQQGSSKPFFLQQFLIVPFKDMDNYLKSTAYPISKGKYHLGFTIDITSSTVLQIRNKKKLGSPANFSKYLNNWNLL